MRVYLNNHTSLCNHAEGSISEYIEKAIKNNTEYYGFSDHAPMGFDPKYRMALSDMSSYEKEVLDAKELYKDKIEILLGYEVDYLDGHMDKRVLEADVDYLIGSVHFIDKWGFDNPEFIGKYEEMDIDEIWQKYFDSIEAMANSKLFDIVGHLDLIKVFKFLNLYFIFTTAIVSSYSYLLSVEFALLYFKSKPANRLDETLYFVSKSIV